MLLLWSGKCRSRVCATSAICAVSSSISWALAGHFLQLAWLSNVAVDYERALIDTRWIPFTFSVRSFFVVASSFVGLCAENTMQKALSAAILLGSVTLSQGAASVGLHTVWSDPYSSYSNSYWYCVDVRIPIRLCVFSVLGTAKPVCNAVRLKDV